MNKLQAALTVALIMGLFFLAGVGLAAGDAKTPKASTATVKQASTKEEIQTRIDQLDRQYSYNEAQKYGYADIKRECENKSLMIDGLQKNILDQRAALMQKLGEIEGKEKADKGKK